MQGISLKLVTIMSSFSRFVITIELFALFAEWLMQYVGYVIGFDNSDNWVYW